MSSMSLFDAFETDKTLEAEGVWVDWGDIGSFKIAAFRNPKHVAVLTKLNAPFKSFALSGREIPADKQEEIATRAMAEAILLDWKTKDRDGSDLVYSTEAAFNLLTELPRFRNQVVSVAIEAETFRAQAVQAAAGN